MKGNHSHPDDFSPYLDCDSSDPGHRGIRAHIEGCAQCRDEVRHWQSVDARFRDSEVLQVPPFQWQRIAARLQSRKPGRLERFQILLRARRSAWSMGLATLVFGVAVWTGIAVHKNVAEKQQLLADISRYASEETKTGPEQNPFQSLADHSNDSNPFAVRR